jgi:hypothetical protein
MFTIITSARSHTACLRRQAVTAAQRKEKRREIKRKK